MDDLNAALDSVLPWISTHRDAVLSASVVLSILSLLVAIGAWVAARRARAVMRRSGG